MLLPLNVFQHQKFQTEQCRKKENRVRRLFLYFMITVGQLYLSLSAFRLHIFHIFNFSYDLNSGITKLRSNSPLSLCRLNKILEIMILPFSLEPGLLLFSNNIYRLAENFSLSFLFCSYHCWQKHDFEDDIRGYYFNASTNSQNIAPQEGSDRDSKVSALLVVPVTGFLADFLPPCPWL